VIARWIADIRTDDELISTRRGLRDEGDIELRVV